MVINVTTGKVTLSASDEQAGVVIFGAATFSLAYVSLTTGMETLILFGSVQFNMIGAALKSGENLEHAQWIG